MRWGTMLFTMLACSVVVPTFAFATPAAGVVSNVIVAQGVTLGPVKERAEVGDSWVVNLEDKGQADVPASVEFEN